MGLMGHGVRIQKRASKHEIGAVIGEYKYDHSSNVPVHAIRSEVKIQILVRPVQYTDTWIYKNCEENAQRRSAEYRYHTLTKMTSAQYRGYNE